MTPHCILAHLQTTHPAKRNQFLSQLLATYEVTAPRPEALAQMERDLACAALDKGGRETIACVYESLAAFVKYVGAESLAAYEAEEAV